MNTIRKRELQGYFYTPSGYVFIGVFLLVSSVLFYMLILRQRSGDLPTFIAEEGLVYVATDAVVEQARAYVGIAMGGLGSDAAIEAADVVLMDDQPTKVALAVRICRLGNHVELKFAHRYWDAATVCLVTSDAQASQPDALSQAFDGAIALGEWVEMDAEARNYMVVDTMTGDPTWNNASEQLARLADEAIVAASQRMTIKMGDVFCLAVVEKRNISIGDTLRVGLNGREILTIKIK